MTLAGVEVDVPQQFWNGDVNIVKAEHLTKDFYIKITFDITGLTLSTYSVAHKATIDVSSVLSNLDNYSSATIEVRCDGVTATGSWLINGFVGRSWKQRSHGSISVVYAPPASDLYCLFVPTTMFGNIYNESADDWENTTSPVMAVTPEYYQNDGIIHLAAGVILQWRFRAAGYDCWYTNGEEVSAGVWEWYADDGESPSLYTDTATPAVSSLAYLNASLSGLARLVVQTDRYTPVANVYTGDVWDYSIRYYHDIEVRPTPCYERMLWVMFTDADGCPRFIPGKVVAMDCDSGNEVYRNDSGDSWNWYTNQGEVGSVIRGRVRKSEYVTIGFENVVAGMHIGDMAMCNRVTLVSSGLFEVSAVVADSSIDEPIAPTDMTIKFRLI